MLRNARSSEAYCYTSKGACGHVLQQGEVGRQRFIAAQKTINFMLQVVVRKIPNDTHSYSSSTGSALGWAMAATASDAPPKGLVSRVARLATRGGGYQGDCVVKSTAIDSCQVSSQLRGFEGTEISGVFFFFLVRFVVLRPLAANENDDDVDV